MPSTPRNPKPAAIMDSSSAAAARLLLALAVFAACPGADALRSLGVGDAKAAGGAGGDAAVDLDASNFTAFLQSSPESSAVVEFFAHWSAPRLWLD